MELLPGDVKKHNEVFAAIHLSMVTSQMTSLKEENDSLKQTMATQYQTIQTIQGSLAEMRKGMTRLLAREANIAAKEEREEKEEKEKEALAHLYAHNGAPPPVNAKFRWTNWNSKSHDVTYAYALYSFSMSHSFHVDTP